MKKKRKKNVICFSIFKLFFKREDNIIIHEWETFSFDM